MVKTQHSCRILMYSHDTFGLGHLTRTLRIARAFHHRYPDASILVLTGSPVAGYVALPPNVDLVKLPSVLKSGKDRYRSRDLRISFKRIRNMRREVIRGTARTFRPHVFLVDNVPLGMKQEVVPTLELLRKEMPSSRIVLNLRDILDARETIRATWEKTGVPQILEEFYDAIFVLGDPAVFDVVSGYDLPPEKTRYVGYATPGAPPRSSTPGDAVPHPPGTAEGPGSSPRTRKRVVLTAGGGGDGRQFLESALQALAGTAVSKLARHGRELEIDLITGPLMTPEDRRHLQGIADSCGARCHEFVLDLPRRISRADLVVAMAGYNTCCEILAGRRYSLLYPRITPRVEQWIRARAFEQRGFSTVIGTNSAGLDQTAIADAAVEALLESRDIHPEALPLLNGQTRLAEHLEGLLPPLVARGHRAPRSEVSRRPPEIPRARSKREHRNENGDSSPELRSQHLSDWSSGIAFWPSAAVSTDGETG
jgi:predicted glycosyltransferase